MERFRLATSCDNKQCHLVWFSTAPFLSTDWYLWSQKVRGRSHVIRALFFKKSHEIEAQINTQEYGRRPYGVGFLVIGQDQSGPHLYEFSPSGNSYEYYAMSIGARSQSAKTYLEKHFKEFADCAYPFPSC